MPTETATSTITTAEVRRQFIDYFVKRHGHTFAPSSPVVPHNDPTLMFTNAGMNQFKDVFLGQGNREYVRAVNTQKCIRAGGKHNDLEDVGRDTYHHTFFEMLGNWSFGDYFKSEAIEWAWDLLTNVWGLDKNRLYVTVFEGDKSEGLEPDIEAENIWKKYVPAERISRWAKKDNFWEMGDTGPCGPCSEIHYDNTPDGTGGHLVNKGDPRVIEIWNLVFIQFNRAEGGKLSPLPAKHVDTGMGLERVTRVLQAKDSNYDIDVFTPIFTAIQKFTGARAYKGELEDPVDIAYRVIADHIRCLIVAITDGARPSNDGRGYVLRRILRRAVRHGHQTLNAKGAWLHELVPTVVKTLGEAFPELNKNHKHVAEVIKDEEESFLSTLDRGIELFEAAGRSAKNKKISAEDAFKLHDTYGFPIDLTRVMAEERGMTVDLIGYEALMEEARAASRKGAEKGEKFTLSPDAIAQLKHLNVQPTDDSHKYQGKPITATVKAIWNGTDFDEHAVFNRRVALILDHTNFYAESGGQVGDVGEIAATYDAGQIPARGMTGRETKGGGRFKVEETHSVGAPGSGYVLHIGRLINEEISVGESVTVDIENVHRNPTMANHTATHVLNFALREVLGEGVDQKGSLVAPDKLRFDFSHSHAMAAEQIERVEQIVNEKIRAHLQVHCGEMPLKTAQSITGVRAVFGERYPDPVRVVAIGARIEDLAANPTDKKWRDFSVEFCGGTHLNDTNAAKHFVITHEGALAAGVRRITALTGVPAVAAHEAGKNYLSQLRQLEMLEADVLVSQFEDLSKAVDDLSMSAIHRQQAHQMIESLREKVKQVRKQAKAGAKGAVVEQARAIADAAQGDTIVEIVDASDRDAILAALDVIKAKHAESAVMLLSADDEEGKVTIVARVPDALIKKGLKAGDWVKQAAQACGGSGGGRPDSAQAGGKDPSKINDAVNAAKVFAQQKMS